MVHLTVRIILMAILFGSAAVLAISGRLWLNAYSNPDLVGQRELGLLSSQIAETPKKIAVVEFFNPDDVVSIRHRDDVRRIHKEFADEVSLIEINIKARFDLAATLYGARDVSKVPFTAVLSSKSGSFFTVHASKMPFPDRTVWTDDNIRRIIKQGLHEEE